MLKYHVVPLELSAAEGASPALVAQKVASLLNDYAAQGWEYMRLESVPVNTQTGCLALLAGSKPQTISMAQLVFCSRA